LSPEEPRQGNGNGTESRDVPGPRDRMVRTAAQLIRRQGVSGTGMREIVADADAPRGSLQHYFPEGKSQIVSEALLMMGGVAARRISRALARIEAPKPSALLDAMVDDWRHDLISEDYTAGCPLVAAAADGASSDERLRLDIREAFDAWQAPLADGLVDLGVPADRAGRLSLLVVSALEGAIVLARIRRDLRSLDTLVEEIGPVLDAAVDG
jgi:AcrR family transcriptional regulator